MRMASTGRSGSAWDNKRLRQRHDRLQVKIDPVRFNRTADHGDDGIPLEPAEGSDLALDWRGGGSARVGRPGDAKCGGRRCRDGKDDR